MKLANPISRITARLRNSRRRKAGLVDFDLTPTRLRRVSERDREREGGGVICVSSDILGFPKANIRIACKRGVTGVHRVKRHGIIDYLTSGIIN